MHPILGWGRLGKETAAHSCLENSTNRGAWGAAVQGVAESQTRLSPECTRCPLWGDTSVRHQVKQLKTGFKCRGFLTLAPKFWRRGRTTRVPPTTPVGKLHGKACLEDSLATSFTVRCASHSRANPTPRGLPTANEHPCSPKSPLSVIGYTGYVFKIIKKKNPPRNNTNVLQLKSD